MTLLRTEHLTKTYASGLFRRNRTPALRDVSISIGPGETVGIYGKSGSGKTTLASLVTGILPATGGRIYWEDRPVAAPYRGALRRAIQMVDQHPEEAFDPRWSLEKSLMEPYRVHRLPFDRDRFRDLLAQVGLYEEHLHRDLGSLSGGELQRAALARALSMEPLLLLLDEPTSMLDAISQAQILQILKDYQANHGTAYLLITHDLAVMRHMCTHCYFLADGCVTGEEEVHGKSESDPPRR